MYENNIKKNYFFNIISIQLITNFMFVIKIDIYNFHSFFNIKFEIKKIDKVVVI